MKPSYVPFLSLWRKNTFPSFHVLQRKDSHYVIADEDLLRVGVYICRRHDLFCSISFHNPINFLKEQLSFVAPHLFGDAKWRCYAIWYDGMMSFSKTDSVSEKYRYRWIRSKKIRYRFSEYRKIPKPFSSLVVFVFFLYDYLFNLWYRYRHKCLYT